LIKRRDEGTKGGNNNPQNQSKTNNTMGKRKTTKITNNDPQKPKIEQQEPY
jgi:hypothetical protein